MSKRERCAWCKQPIMGTPVQVERFVCAATMQSPAEYETVAMHTFCRDRASDTAYGEWLKDEQADRQRNERAGL